MSSMLSIQKACRISNTLSRIHHSRKIVYHQEKINPIKTGFRLRSMSTEDVQTTNKKNPYTLLVVAVALVNETSQGRQVLLAERPSKKHLEGLYEFPGGKVEPHESPELALVRELEEELGISVDANDLHPLTFASHGYSEKGFHLLMPVFSCSRWQGVPEGREQQKLVWATAHELDSYDMPPADYPLLPAIKSLLLN
jgi:8-oxo-dGTP diphosphatase